MRPVFVPLASGPTISRSKPPTFSVVVPAYQAAAFVGEAIESVLRQTCPPVELIVCDDGSTDDLDGALAPYRGSLVVLRKENGGEASAKNMGARAASGEFVAILDADDIYLPERLEALRELSLRRPDLDILTADCQLTVGGRVIRRCYAGTYRFEVDDQRRGILERNFVGPGHMAVRRAALLAAGGFDESFLWATDWDCWIRMIFTGSRVGMVNQPLAEHRVRSTSLASNRVRQFEAYVAVLEKAKARSDLSSHERAVLVRSLDTQRQRLRLSEAEAAFAEGNPDARRLGIALARDKGVRLSTRAQMALAAALPRGVSQRLARRHRELAGGVRASAR